MYQNTPLTLLFSLSIRGDLKTVIYLSCRYDGIETAISKSYRFKYFEIIEIGMLWLHSFYFGLTPLVTHNMMPMYHHCIKVIYSTVSFICGVQFGVNDEFLICNEYVNDLLNI